MEVHLGIDAGGTRTRAALVDAQGTVLGVGSDECSLPRAVGVERGGSSLGRAVEAAWHDANCAPSPLSGVGAGFAGAGDEAARAEIHAFLTSALTLAPGADVRVEHDLSVAYRGAFGEGAGVVIVAGTGSAAFAVDRAGNEVRAGGFGPYADDAGSGFDLGRSALSAALRALDGRVQRTRLVDVCRRGLSVANESELVAVLRRGVLMRSSVAALAPGILGLAREGDVVARQLVERAASELTLAATTVAKRAARSAPRVACVGGLFRDATFVDTFRHALAESDSTARCVRPRLEPEVGAAWLSICASVSANRSELFEALATSSRTIVSHATFNAEPRSRA